MLSPEGETHPGGTGAGPGQQAWEDSTALPSQPSTPSHTAGRGSAPAIPLSGPAWASHEDGPLPARAHPAPRSLVLCRAHSSQSAHTC